MINLKLAEYNLETGKFERFLELGKDFEYGGSFIHTKKGGEMQAVRLRKFEDVLGAILNHEEINLLCQATDLFLKTFDGSFVYQRFNGYWEAKVAQRQKLVDIYEQLKQEKNTDFNLEYQRPTPLYRNIEEQIAEGFLEIYKLFVNPDLYQTCDQGYIKILKEYNVSLEDDDFAAKILSICLVNNFFLKCGVKDSNFRDPSFLKGKPLLISTSENPITYEDFYLDPKDPLNRFDGLFDGRTYGDGKFVLVESKIIDRFDKKIMMSQDDIFSYDKYIQKAVAFINFDDWQEIEKEAGSNPNFKILGNIHKNPELYSKIK